MKIEQIPFNHFLGITVSGSADRILELEPQAHHLNHVGSIHAAAMFALAEASSGEFMLRQRGYRDDIVGLVRRASSKYTKPAHRLIFTAITNAAEISPEAIVAGVDQRGKLLLPIQVAVYQIGVRDEVNAAEELVGSFEFTWLLAKDE